jgi:FdhD protein
VSRNILTVPILRVEDHSSASVQDLLAVEEPLEIRLCDKTVSITMRTPGQDSELACGFLFTEGILVDRGQIQDIQSSSNSATVHLKAGVEVDFERLERHFYTSSSCGVCGKASIDALRMQGCPMAPNGTPRVASEVIHSLPEALREDQRVFERTGGLHGAALFDATGALLATREDVGRHNAVDKVIGSEFLAGRLPLSDKLLLVSGRASFELTQKALMAGIPMLVAVGAPSSLAVETARRFNMTLVGFVRDTRFNIYSGASRIQ